ncbi:MAG: hypothetical protein MI919_00980 [Holophagales bacterium]|nr:hypothetical protein [Holophagales bacterium]
MRTFDDQALELLAAATAEAERRTAGEIVPYVVARVDTYPEARSRGAALGAVLFALTAGVLHQVAGLWGGSGLLWVTLPALAGASLGWLAAELPWIGRNLVSAGDLDHRVRLRAEAAVLEEEVFRTRDRTGILILLALWEHRAVILADEGIHRAVPEGTWEGVVGELVAGIRAGRSVDALREAIERCGEILESHGVAIRPDDEDELDDSVRLRER